MWLVVLGLLLIPGVGTAQSGEWTRVVVGGLDAPGNETRNIIALQAELRRLRGVRLETTRNYRTEAQSHGVARLVPDDSQALLDVCAALQVDAVIYGRVTRGDGRDDQLNLTVYSGRSGTIVGEEPVRVPRGKLTRGVWRSAAAAVERLLFAALEARPPPPPPMPEPEPMVLPIIEIEEYVEQDEGRTDGVVVSVHGGLALVGRSFSYRTRQTSPILTEGIEYDSPLAPGFALDVEFYPARLATTGAVSGLGIGVLFERVAVVTKQLAEMRDEMSGEVVSETIKLDTAYMHILVHLLYQYLLGEGHTAIELKGHLGYGYLEYALDLNRQYNGSAYGYLDLGASGYIPLGTRYAAIEAGASILPAVSLGESVKEVGKDASIFGWRIQAGFASRPLDALSARLLFDYTSFGADVTGVGRGGREGKRADDGFLAMRLMVGYRY